MLELYKNIKTKRLEKGWSQEELAKKVGYSDKSMIAKIESGKVDISQTKIAIFAKALDCTPSDLMGFDEPGTEEEEFIKRAVLHYKKCLSADRKTRSIIDQLLEEGD